MTTQLDSESRRRVREVFGDDVADKATAAFCQAFVARADAPEAANASTDASEATFPPPGMQPVVLELTPEPAAPIPLRDAVESLRRTPGWSKALDATRSALGASLDPRSALRVNALLNPTAMLREVYVRELRERCHRAAAPIRTELEGAAARLRARIPKQDAALYHTQYCWLNQTFRVWLDEEALKHVAPSSVIRHIDIPHEMELETSESGMAVFATQYRQHTTRGGRGVVVAVIDSEVMRSHPAFEDRVCNMGNFSHQDWGDPQPHGTEVAGIIAARHGKFSGMAPDAIIYSYKVKPQNHPEDFFAARALQQALEDGAHIANCSWGVRNLPVDGTSRLALACDRAWECGMTIVKSAGNDGHRDGKPSEQTISCPGDAKGVIVVGATSRNGSAVLAGSSRGPVSGKDRCPDMVAPGGDGSDSIRTCAVSGDFEKSREGLTSFAAAHVSGLLALLLEAEPDSTPDELRERLLGLCKKLKGPDSGKDPDENVQGSGFVSLRMLVRQDACPENVEDRAGTPRPAGRTGRRARPASAPARSG